MTTTTGREALIGLLFLACTLTGAILAVEWWHWRWALYGLLTAVFAASAAHCWPTRPAHTGSGCPWCGQPAGHQPSPP